MKGCLLCVEMQTVSQMMTSFLNPPKSSRKQMRIAWSLLLMNPPPSWIACEAQENWDDLSQQCRLVAGYISKKSFRKSTVNSAEQIYAKNAATQQLSLIYFDI
ncbi:hypothetical protein AVEN_7191-1 [Araneus ventricosus]|uniref:Uncharacterized protein n=1 Tax=Araneus ventricosus TaxID=182803 RepID=A0A4Y2R3C4_ARAVE|nr:hypothetical protein AVEN_7191-1 [Araneus ventricosus]